MKIKKEEEGKKTQLRRKVENRWNTCIMSRTKTREVRKREKRNFLADGGDGVGDLSGNYLGE